MPSRRNQIAMTPAEIDAYLREQRRIILITIGPDGMPHPMPMNYGVDEAGRVVFSTFRKSQKVRNVERDPRASLLVESGATYPELKAVILYCAVEIVDDYEQMRSAMSVMRGTSDITDSITPQRKEQIEASMAKRVVLRCTPQRAISWDHAKLGAFY
jgi:PPOX class probable F420-dependent enzyme